MVQSHSYRISAFLLALLMLISSVGFSLDLHYCQGNFKNLAFFKEAKSCHELALKASSEHCKKMQKPCAAQNLEKECEKSCCSHHTILIEAETDIFQAKIIEPGFLSSDLIIAFVYTFGKAYPSTVFVNNYNLYKPPVPDKDRSVLFQSFLI